jgi:hypothetical protein
MHQAIAAALPIFRPSCAIWKAASAANPAKGQNNGNERPEQRIAVLERIGTDKDVETTAQIGKLRYALLNKQEAKMGPFEMVVLIVLITVGGGIYSRHLKDKGKRDPAQEAERLKLRSEVDQLSRRVQTLEKLATDPAARLADDIERLREARN